ncbi:Z1 domain-containing protein [Streptomyces sp. NPDC048581]|uniref:Z1 domain-containing protein n=1 Tax=Streptomyces sp. NPDC048581 TaxID=3365572 RepID=UPI00371CB565
MSDNVDALYGTFRLVLELSHCAARLEQLGLNAREIDALNARHALRKEQAMWRGAGPVDAWPSHALWYTGPREGDVYWPAFVHQLGPHTPHRAAFTALDDASTRIVSHLRHPKEPSFATRGLVVAYPQSGTATNIAAVIAKAADRGYRLFIVLAGVHNALREQMQMRLTQQLIGPHPARWVELTTTARDFQPTITPPAGVLGASGGPALCVVKKNVTVLRKLTKWLAAAPSLLHEYPTLIIDTEADQPSVASASITPRIGSLLKLLPRAAYVGYTHTPLAGLLLEPGADDLFPEDFIVTLPRPDHYSGPEILFGGAAREQDDPEQADDGYDMIRLIPDEDVPQLRPISRAQVEDFTPQVPDSLRHAVEYFWLVAAARHVRGSGTPHNTMLIHTSVNTTVHASFMAPLQALRAHAAHQLASPSYLEHLRNLWQHETRLVPAEDFDQETVGFAELLAHLPAVLQDCRILTDNASSNDRLDYTPGPVTAVVVGGTTLARGLALEGMSVGYFVTAVTAYDTLHQMERWFGFRAGYADLPRIWMTDELSAGWREIIGAQTELRQQLERAADEGTSPLNLALRVRSHPQLRIVRAAKQGQPIVSVSYGGRRVQTRYFHTNASWLRANLQAADTLVAASISHASHTQAHPDLGRYLFYNVPAQLVIDFLTSYQFHERSSDADPYLLIDYIEKRIARANSLRHWNVALLGKPSETGDDTLTFADNITVGRIVRSRLASTSPESDVADIKTLMSRRDAAIDLAGDINHLSEHGIKHARRIQLPHTGLLALYPIDKTSAPSTTKKTRAPLNAEEHVIGVGMVLPEPETIDSTV